jgi:hypothetical protein
VLLEVAENRRATAVGSKTQKWITHANDPIEAQCISTVNSSQKHPASPPERRGLFDFGRL